MFRATSLLALLASAVFTTAAFAQGAWHQYFQSATKSFNNGDYTQSETDCRKSLKEMPPDDPRYTLSLLQLGKIYLAQKRADKASRAFTYGMDLCRERRPMDLPLYSDLLSEQAQAYKAMNRLDLAKIAEEQLSFIAPKSKAGAAAQESQGDSQATPVQEPEWKQLRSALANCYREQRFADAEPMLKRYLRLMEEECGQDSPLLAPVLAQYARVLHYLGKADEAEHYQELSKNVGAVPLSPPQIQDSLAELDKRTRAILKDQRERERREIEERAKEEERIAAAQQRERELQLTATREFEESQLAAHMEREKAAMSARTRFSTVSPETMSLRQRAVAEAHASMPITPGSIPDLGSSGTPVSSTTPAHTTLRQTQQTPYFTSPAVFSSAASGVSIGGLGFSASIGNASK